MRLIDEMINNEVENIVAQLEIARDSNQLYFYHQLTNREDGYNWSDSQINEILNRIFYEISDLKILSHSENTFKESAGTITERQRIRVTILFQLIYN